MINLGAMHNLLPRVPNVACLIPWLKDIFCDEVPVCVEDIKSFAQTGQFKQFQTCETESPKGLLTLLNPPRVLPALSEVDAHESRHRFDYWLSFLVWGPILMSILCELIRAGVAYMKQKPLYHERTSREVSRKDYDPLTVGPGASSSQNDELRRQAVQHAAQRRFALVFIIMYHIFCACLVTVSFCNDWASLMGGGSFSWELWALWQHVCLWTLFLQNLVRCWKEDAQSLQHSTALKVLLYTCPGLSELADTMKDWIVAGICLKATPTAIGFACGGVIVLADLAHRSCNTPPNMFPCRINENLQMFPSFTTMPLLSVLLWLVFWLTLSDPSGVYLFIIVPCVCILGSLLALGYFSLHIASCLSKFGAIFFILILSDWAIEQTWPSKATAATHQATHKLVVFLCDGGCLALLSAYTIFLSHILVASDGEIFGELRKTYQCILALPKGAPIKVASCSESIADKAAGLAVDLCSAARLLIAWAEDLPQGFLGLALVLAHQGQIRSAGFAAASAVTSLVKGTLIPLGQGMVLADRMTRVRRCLYDMEGFIDSLDSEFDTKGFLAAFGLVKSAAIEAMDIAARIPTVAGRKQWREDKRKCDENFEREMEILMSSYWELFDKAIQKRKEIARKRFNIGGTLLQPVDAMIQMWLKKPEYVRPDSEFFADLKELLDASWFFDGSLNPLQEP